jgi:caffeoyl-CoA O-methyltransferase
MKARIDAIIQRDQAEYLDRLIPQTDPLLREMEAYGGQHNVPSADREVALFVEITARAINAKRALEIGMAIGYTTTHLARAVGEDGEVVTIDPSDEMIKAAEGYLTRAGVRDRVRIERGKALEVIPLLKDTFDLVFIDAVKEEYADYLRLSLPRLRNGGVVIVDNLLWGGQVAGEIRSADQESSTNALREFNKYFVNHPKLRAEVLPVGDGLGYAVKIAEEGQHRGHSGPRGEEFKP